MNSITSYVLLTARRDWLFLGILLILLLFILLAMMIGSNSLVEQSQTITVLLASCCRILVIFGMGVFTCFHIKHSFANKEIEFFLSKPITRKQFLLSYFAGLAITSSLLISIIGIVMLCLLHVNLLYGFAINYILWTASLMLETMIVIAVALFAALLLKSSIIPVLVTFGFYILSRTMGFLLIMLYNPASLNYTSYIGKIASNILFYISFLFPRLDQFTQSEWLIYGAYGYNFAGAAILYIALILSMAIYDFQRYEF